MCAGVGDLGTVVPAIAFDVIDQICYDEGESINIGRSVWIQKDIRCHTLLLTGKRAA